MMMALPRKRRSTATTTLTATIAGTRRNARGLPWSSRDRGQAPKRRSGNATSGSRTDPDDKLRGKPGQRPHLVHRAQIEVDPKARCVVGCLGETADGHEGDVLDLNETFSSETTTTRATRLAGVNAMHRHDLGGA
jgi:hypothetical protein